MCRAVLAASKIKEHNKNKRRQDVLAIHTRRPRRRQTQHCADTTQHNTTQRNATHQQTQRNVRDWPCAMSSLSSVVSSSRVLPLRCRLFSPSLPLPFDGKAGALWNIHNENDNDKRTPFYCSGDIDIHQCQSRSRSRINQNQDQNHRYHLYRHNRHCHRRGLYSSYSTTTTATATTTTGASAATMIPLPPILHHHRYHRHHYSRNGSYWKENSNPRAQGNITNTGGSFHSRLLFASQRVSLFSSVASSPSSKSTARTSTARTRRSTTRTKNPDHRQHHQHQHQHYIFPTTATTLEGLWKESTARFLDPERSPVGSLNSLQWHLAETLILYWSQQTTTTTTTNHKSYNNNHSNTTTNNNSTSTSTTLEAMKEGHRMALTILDRLAEEKVAFAATNATTNNTDNTNADDIDNTNDNNIDNDNNNNDADDDFRTIDVSLVHAFLKQWKDCLHKSSSSNYSNRQYRHHHHQHQQRQHHQQHPGDVLLPSQLLQKLDDWVSASDCSASPLLEPNIATFTLVMDGAVSCRRYQESAGFCEALIERLFRESNSNNKRHLKPTMVTLGNFLRALANHKTVASAELAESWLRKIPDLLAPDDSDGNGKRNNDGNNSDGERAVVAAAEVRPNTVVYTTVIRAWASLGRADRAEDLLREMCQEYYHYCCNHGNNINDNDNNSNNNNSNYYSWRDQDETAAAAAKPNLWTFNTVLAAWSRSRDPGAVQKAESLLRTMESLSLSSNSKARNVQDLENDNDNDNGGPTTTTTNIKNNFSDSDGLDRFNPFEKKTSSSSSSSSSSSLTFKLDVAPTIVSYNSLMSTIASRSLRPDSLARAESWMEELLGKANAAATTTAMKREESTSAVVGNIGSKHALRRNGSNNSNNNHYSRYNGENMNDSSLVPNLITYKALFNIIAASGHLSDSEKADRMRYWLARGKSVSSSSSPLSAHSSLPPLGAGSSEKNNSNCNGIDGNVTTTSRHHPSLQNHPLLLEQIHALENKKPKNY